MSKYNFPNLEFWFKQSIEDVICYLWSLEANQLIETVDLWKELITTPNHKRVIDE